jgi:hypothetical protein
MEKVIRASLDRIEGDFAVVHLDDEDGDEEEEDDEDAPNGEEHHHHHNNNKFDVPLELVKGAKPGMRLQLHIENDEIKYIEIDREATEEARDRIGKKYERLRRGRHLRRHNSL